MKPEELEKFNIELKALLIKYDANLRVGHSIQVFKNETEAVAEPVEEKTA